MADKIAAIKTQKKPDSIPSNNEDDLVVVEWCLGGRDSGTQGIFFQSLSAERDRLRVILHMSPDTKVS
jgi:hypothetical protein